MKEYISCHLLWCVSLVVGIALSVCTDENFFFLAVSEAVATESEQAEQEFPVAEDRSALPPFPCRFSLIESQDTHTLGTRHHPFGIP